MQVEAGAEQDVNGPVTTPPAHQPNDAWGVARDAAPVAIIRAAGFGLAFAFSVALAQRAGGSGAGAYYLAFTIVSVVSIVSRIGMDNALVRLIADSDTRDQGRHIDAIFGTAVRMTTALSAVATLALALGAPLIATAIFGDDAITAPLRAMSIAIGPIALTSVIGRSLIGTGRVVSGMLVEGGALPAVHLALYLVASRSGSATGASLALLAGNVIVLIGGVAVWRRARAAAFDGARGPVEHWRRRLCLTALPLMWVALLATLSGLVGTFVLGVLSTTTAAGVFAVSSRAARLGVLALASVNTALAPRFARLHAGGDNEQLRSLLTRSIGATAAAAVAISLPLLVAAPHVVALFGSSFDSAVPTLRILVLASAIDIASGPLSMLLQMTERERELRNISAVAVAAQVVLAVALVPSLGAAGAAWAVVAAQVTVNSLAGLTIVRGFARSGQGPR